MALSTHHCLPSFLKASLILKALNSQGVSGRAAVRMCGKSTGQSTGRLGFSPLPCELPALGTITSHIWASVSACGGPVAQSSEYVSCSLLCCFRIKAPLCLCLSFPSVLPLRCVINQEFTVKAQEELNDVFSSGKYLVPQGARGCLRSPMPPELWVLRAFSVDPPTQLQPLMWL